MQVLQNVLEFFQNLIGMYKIYHIIPTFALLTVALGAVIGLIRGGKKALARFITLLAALVLSYIIAKLLGQFLTYAVLKIVELTVAKGSEYDGLQWLAANGTAVRILLRAVITPLLLPCAYSLSKGILRFLYKDLRGMTFFKTVKHRFLNRLGGAGMGALCGAVSAFVMLLPLVGYLSFATDSYHKLDKSTIGEGAAVADTVVARYVDCLTEGGPVNAVYDVIGEPIFYSLSSSSSHGVRASVADIFDDVNGVITSWNESGMKANQEYGEQQLLVVQEISHDVRESPFLSALLSDVAHGASDAWLQNKTFAGLGRLELGEEMEPIFDGLLRVLATSEIANIDNDLGSISDIITIMDEYGVLAGEFEVTGDFVSALVGVVDENRRMMPLYTALTQRGMQEVFGEIENVDEYLDEYGDMINNIADEIKITGDTPEQLADNVKGVLSDNNIEVTDEQSQMITTIITGTFTREELATMTKDQIVERLYDTLGITDALQRKEDTPAVQ